MAARTCRECGTRLDSGEALFCGDACRDAYTEEVLMPKLQAAGPAKLAELRCDGADPSKTEAALEKVGATQSVGQRPDLLGSESMAVKPVTLRGFGRKCCHCCRMCLCQP